MNSAVTATGAPSATIASLWEFLAPGNCEQAVFWPPDVFALVGAVLERTGGYTYAVSSHWPPAEFRGDEPETWAEFVADVGARWRTAIAQRDPEAKAEQLPEEIVVWWGEMLERAGAVTLAQVEATLHAAFEDGVRCELTERLLQLWAAADEACAGAGLPYNEAYFSGDEDYLNFLREAQQRLVFAPGRDQPATLCRYVTSGEVIVLPKLHTPQCGVTLRSLSHHLAFTSMREVIPVWGALTPEDEVAETPAAKDNASTQHSLNLLLLPWPEEVLPRNFSPAARDGGNPPHQRFNYTPQLGADPAERLRRAIEEAERIVGTVDGVVLPELALKDEAEARALAAVAWEKNASRIFVTGVGGAEDARGFGVNKAVVFAKVGGSRNVAGEDAIKPFVQEKHHRWQLDRAQIEQYGLGGRLDPATSWWENTRIGRRHVGFLTVRPWLTMTVLICEDLARQEPVAEVVRAVGPNLVIALLMDGPQLAARWPARYATVLAEDPGSSVLTLTSIGMTKLCRPAGVKPSRVIGLWKDRNRSPIEIELPEGATGVVLSLTRQSQRERSLDHRDDRGGSFSLYLGGAHPVYLRPVTEKPAVQTLTKPASGV